LWHSDFADEVGQQLPFTQAAAKQLQTTASLETIFLELSWGISADDVNLGVAKENRISEYRLEW
jgi:hypothetical protein